MVNAFNVNAAVSFPNHKSIIEKLSKFIGLPSSSNGISSFGTKVRYDTTPKHNRTWAKFGIISISLSSFQVV